MKILYIDDSYSDRLLAGKTLKGVNLVLEDSINKALLVLKDESFDLIVCDVFLGKSDGVSFISAYADAGGKTPILLTSGVEDMALLSKYKDMPNFIGFIPKPITLDVVRGLYEKR